MQLKSSLRQLWVESRANPTFTSLYVGGVAFAVGFTMVFAIIYYVHLAPIYPEYNRATTQYISNITIQNEKTNNMGMGSLGLPFFHQFIKDSENIEHVTLTNDFTSLIQPDDNSGDFKVMSRTADPEFFNIYPYEFIAGRPFNEAETDAAMKVAVIDSSLADRLYGSAEQAINKEISVTYKKYKVIGVVRDSNPIAFMSYANVFVPYTVFTSPGDNLLNGEMFNYLGSYSIPLKFKDKAQAERFRAELTDKISRTNAADTAGWVIDLRSAPVSHSLRVLAHSQNGDDLNLWMLIRPLLLILAVLLIIPAINISGMISGQMDRRLAEIGIRRSFGATRNQLTGQVMFENFVLTLIGGFIGLIIAWVMVLTCRTLLLQLLIPSWECTDASASVSGEMIFSPVIFLATIIICLILNMLSAYIPVRLSLRRPIISSINSKR